MSKKVKCSLCMHAEGNRCLVKKATIKIGKRRRCDDYQLDPTKVVIRSKPKSRYAPLWELNGKVRRKLIKEMNDRNETVAQEKALTENYASSPPAYLDKQGDAPDCLAGIRSSVGG